ncbi:type II toxin-antitoxin system RelE/ParE family toxin [Candidatus Thiodictyon syntrophicum]|uniref:type II toxin-antitoxin system RelE/ParE family toxin n=1 Tax=Candidatus Thiodictyon syntrophicum TaxID=1166950 RepID=UPI0012FDD32E|nr:type II toxin-antitoxin system RelE/ParE family toxin [Candidatus Thiodictyon syntrophicum]
MIEVRYHEAAEAELYEALGFLELRAKGLGRRLLREVRRTAARIAECPLLAPEIRPGVRKRGVHTFPYALVYAIEDDGVLILAVAHGSRRPDYWGGRLAAP